MTARVRFERLPAQASGAKAVRVHGVLPGGEVLEYHSYGGWREVEAYALAAARRKARTLEAAAHAARKDCE